MENISHQKAYVIIKKHYHCSNPSNWFKSLKDGTASHFSFVIRESKIQSCRATMKVLKYTAQNGWYIQ